MAFAPQGGGQIEAEAVDPHGLHPPAQAVQDQTQHIGVGDVERVPAAGLVDVAALLPVTQAIVGGIVQSAERKGRPVLVAFGGVVVDHVQDDLETRGVELAHRLAKAAGTGRAEVARLGGQEADAVVAPVVDEALFEQSAIVHEGMDRQQLQRRDAERGEMLPAPAPRRGPRSCRATPPAGSPKDG